MSCISINLKKEETLVKIEDNATKEEIINELDEKMVELAKLYKDEKTPIRVTGKILSDDELQEVKSNITEHLNVTVSFDTPTSLGLHSIIRSYKENIENSETLFHTGSLRSGQRLEFDGSIVIVGDVNAGAEVVAGDNIIVQGALRGLAHAGAKGNKGAIVTAGLLDAVQVRISNIVREIDKNEELSVHRAFICVKGNKIKIETW